MWAVQYRRHGGPEHLEVVQAPTPAPRAGQALVRVTASCVSQIDAEYLAGRLPHGVGFPRGVGFDAIGEVMDSNGTPLEQGRWVAIVLGLEPLARRGTTVELLAIEPDRCGMFPASHVPAPEDCSLVLGGLTALKAVRDRLGSRPGDRVLVVGAGGPVGLAAIQIAALHGATVDAVAGERALAMCRGLGARHAWDHRGDTTHLKSSGAYDGIVLAAGPPGEWLGALRRHGRMAITDGRAWPGSIPGAIRQQVRTLPVAAGHASGDLTWLAERSAARDLIPVVGSRHTPSHIRSAFEALTSPGTLGARLIDHTEAS